jgi:hypothetical protein
MFSCFVLGMALTVPVVAGSRDPVRARRRYKSCEQCVAAGWGWDATKGCGVFSIRKCTLHGKLPRSHEMESSVSASATNSVAASRDETCVENSVGHAATQKLIQQLQFGQRSDAAGQDHCDAKFERFMFVQPSPYMKGMGACVTELASCMHYALANNRTMVVDGSFFQYQSEVTDVVQPVSGCTKEQILSRAQTENWQIYRYTTFLNMPLAPGDNIQQVAAGGDTPPPRRQARPRAGPRARHFEELAIMEGSNVMIMDHKSGATGCKGIDKEGRKSATGTEVFKIPASLRPHINWRVLRGEILQHLLRPARHMEDAMSLVRQLTAGNTVGIHIRHGADKHYQSGGLQPLSKYLELALQLSQGFKDNKPITFVVASDKATVPQLCREYLRIKQSAQPAGVHTRVRIASQDDVASTVQRFDASTMLYTDNAYNKRSDAFLGVMLDTLLLGNCDYLVGSCNSYIGTIAGAIRIARQVKMPDALPRHRAVQVDTQVNCARHPDWHDMEMWTEVVNFSREEEEAQGKLTWANVDKHVG